MPIAPELTREQVQEARKRERLGKEMIRIAHIVDGGSRIHARLELLKLRSKVLAGEV